MFLKIGADILPLTMPYTRTGIPLRFIPAGEGNVIHMKNLLTKRTNIILNGILGGINGCQDIIKSIEKTGRGDMPVTGIALELFPWHGEFGLSLRLSDEFPMADSRYDSADWKYFNFTTEREIESIISTKQFVANLYESEFGEDCSSQDIAHLLFFSGAMALIDPKVTSALREFDIDAPFIGNQFVSSSFEYIVFDGDALIKSNYCDLVLMDRINRRLMKLIV